MCIIELPPGHDVVFTPPGYVTYLATDAAYIFQRELWDDALRAKREAQDDRPLFEIALEVSRNAIPPL